MASLFDDENRQGSGPSPETGLPVNNVRVLAGVDEVRQAHTRNTSVTVAGVPPRNETNAVAMGLATPDPLEVEDRPRRSLALVRV